MKKYINQRNRQLSCLLSCEFLCMKLFERWNLPSFFPLGEEYADGWPWIEKDEPQAVSSTIREGVRGSPQLTPSLLSQTWNNFEGGSLEKKNVPVKLSKCLPFSFSPQTQKSSLMLMYANRESRELPARVISPCRPKVRLRYKGHNRKV